MIIHQGRIRAANIDELLEIIKIYLALKGYVALAEPRITPVQRPDELRLYEWRAVAIKNKCPPATPSGHL